MIPFASAAPPLRAAALLAGVAAAAALWAALAGLIALLGLHRWSGHLAWSEAPLWLWRVRHAPQAARWLRIGALASGVVLAAGAAGLAGRLRPPLHGAARFAREAEIRRLGLRARDGLLLGRAGGRFLSFGGDEHVLLYAPTRSGKGVGVVIPNLLNWPHAAVVLDVKRENYLATAGFRAAHGQTVHLFDPLAAPGTSARYNPLAHIQRRDPVEVMDELQKIAGMLFPAEGGRADPFWAEAARTGFMGVGAYVAETPALAFTLGQIFRELTTCAPKSRFPELIAARARTSKPLSTGCASALTDFCAASDNTFASIRQTITARMGLWLNPRVDAATAASDFDLRDLRSQRVTLYLAASPDNLVRVAPLYNLLFQQLVDLNTRVLPAPDDPGRVLLLLDEFARLGHAGAIAHGFAFVAGYGLRILAVLQSPSQLRAVYGPDLAEEIVANCGVEIAFTPKELKVAQELSERLGFYTYTARARSRPSGLAAGRRSLTESDQRRALMLPQELLQMPRRRLLVLRAGVPPVRGEKIVYWRERVFIRRLRPPPASSRTGPLDLAGLSAEVAAIRSAVEDIRIRLVERPMTAAEAAGQGLSPELISLALEDVDMAELPPGRMSEAAARAWVDDYVARAAHPPELASEPRISDPTGA